MNLMRLNKLRKISLIIAGMLIAGGIFAQSGIDSPYSRFGVGNLEPAGSNPRMRAMGGIGNAIGSNRFINPSNAASYASFDTLSFLFNVGISFSNVNYRTTVQSESGYYTNIAYFSAGFPILKWWKSAVGLQPYSHMSYDVRVKSLSDNNLSYVRSYSGEGGLNQLYFGNAFSIHKNFALGANASYVFGRNVTSSMLYFPDSAYIANTKVDDRMLVSDFMFDLGLFYTLRFSDNLGMHLGLTYAPDIDLGVGRERLVVSQFGGFDNQQPRILDTIFYAKKQKGTMTIPARYGFGMVMEKQNSWLVGLDFDWQNWEEFRIMDVGDSTNNTWKISFGGEYTPTHTSISGYWKRVTYRMGANYRQTYLSINGQDIDEFGISFGVSLPMPRSLTSIDLSLEVGRRGTTANHLIRETFATLTAGVTIYERWFMKRKYN